MKAALVVLVFASLVPLMAQGRYCQNFEIPVLGKDLIYAQYKNAVIRITSGDEVGTGYLIDSERGYVLTATHVVQPSLSDTTVPIHATNSTNAGSTKSVSKTKLFTLVHLHNLGPDSVALLQLNPPNAMEHTAALDIALRIPLSSRPTYVFGYPREQLELSQQSTETTNGNENGTLTVKQAAFPGDSGSPLIDETGKVVATCLERVLTAEQHVSNEAIYVPTAAISQLLDMIDITKRVEGIDNALRSKTIGRDELVEDLMPLPDRDHLSNVDLYAWAYHLWKKPSNVIESGAFPCPFLRALVHRKLEDAEERLQKHSDANTRAMALFYLGNRAHFFDDNSKAVATYSQANQLLAQVPDRKLDDEGKELRVSALRALGGLQDNGDRAQAYFQLADSIAKDVETPPTREEYASYSLPEWLRSRDSIFVKTALKPTTVAFDRATFSDVFSSKELLAVLVVAVVAGILALFTAWWHHVRRAKYTRRLIKNWQEAKARQGIAEQLTPELIEATNYLAQGIRSKDISAKLLVEEMGEQLHDFVSPEGPYWDKEKEQAGIIDYATSKFGEDHDKSTAG